MTENNMIEARIKEEKIHFVNEIFDNIQENIEKIRKTIINRIENAEVF